MEHTNEALSYAIYMANAWNINECAKVFNGIDNSNNSKEWKYSIGEHIWNKYLEYAKNYTIFDAYMRLLYELDNENLNKILNRACELYDGRKNRK